MKLKAIKSHFKKNDPAIYKVLKTMEFEILTPPKSSHSFFKQLCHEIISQQLAGSAAKAIINRFNQLITKRITPARVLSFTDQQYRDVGLSWAKASYIRDLAKKVTQKQVKLSHLKKLDNHLVIEELVKVKGIGPWTAEMFLIFTLGREDVFSAGDLGLKKGLIKLYNLNDIPTEKQINKVIKNWSPYKSYASLALWHSLDNS